MDERILAILSMGPDDKDVIDKSFPDHRSWSVVVHILVFELTHEGVGIGMYHSCTMAVPPNCR